MFGIYTAPNNVIHWNERILIPFYLSICQNNVMLDWWVQEERGSTNQSILLISFSLTSYQHFENCITLVVAPNKIYCACWISKQSWSCFPMLVTRDETNCVYVVIEQYIMIMVCIAQDVYQEHQACLCLCLCITYCGTWQKDANAVLCIDGCFWMVLLTVSLLVFFFPFFSLCLQLFMEFFGEGHAFYFLLCACIVFPSNSSAHCCLLQRSSVVVLGMPCWRLLCYLQFFVRRAVCFTWYLSYLSGLYNLALWSHPLRSF